MILSIIIVSYNVRQLLEQCLHSVVRAAGNLDTEVWVVDNDSSDGSTEHLKPIFPRFHFVQNTSNVGFAKANNQALALSSGAFILFLNPDTVLPPDALRRCVAFMQAHADAGAMGVRMVDGNGHYLPESKRGLPSPMVSFWKLTGVTAMFPRSPRFARYYLGHLDAQRTHAVDVLSGAFFFARRSVLDITGGFDERFFMYAEDIDLSYRILKAGYRNYYFPTVTIVHYKGGSTKKDLRYVRQFYLAMSQYVKKHYGRGAFSYVLDAGIWLRASLEAIKSKLS